MTDFQYVAAAIIAVLSAARLSRLVTSDSYPPSAWLRGWWDEVTHDGPWSELAHCGYCFTVWTAGFVVGWAWWSGLDGPWGTAWWIFNGFLATAYAAAIVQVNDGSKPNELRVRVHNESDGD